MKNIIFPDWLSLLTLCSSPALADNTLSCSFEHAQVQENFHSTAHYHFATFGTEGVFSVNGEILYANKNYVISREIYFNYKKSQNTYVLTSTRHYPHPLDDTPAEVLEKNIPAFFFNLNENLVLRFKEEKQNRYLVSTFSSSMPLFLCITR